MHWPGARRVEAGEIGLDGVILRENGASLARIAKKLRRTTEYARQKLNLWMVKAAVILAYYRDLAEE